MGDLTRQIVIATSVQVVFNHVADPWNAPSYISSIEAILSGPKGTPLIGQTWQARANFLGRRSAITLRLADLRSPHLVRFIIDGEPQATLALHISPSEDPASWVALTLDVPSVPSFLLGALMSGLLAADMERLKKALEG